MYFVNEENDDHILLFLFQKKMIILKSSFRKGFLGKGGGMFCLSQPRGKKKGRKNEAHNYVIIVGGVLVSYILLYIYK